jgi:type II secretory pathway pseudopilin PulG
MGTTESKVGSALHKVTRTSRIRARAFTLIDLLVSLAIVSILIALMLPAISMVRESTRKVVCASNLRQVGLAINMFADDNGGLLPDSQFLPEEARANTYSVWLPERMDTVLLRSDDVIGNPSNRWDGLGHLIQGEYLSAPNTFYCPSHRGNFMFEDAQSDWARVDSADEIIVNYLYRGMGPNFNRRLYRIDARAALTTDTIRSYEDLNHKDGFNVMQAGLAVDWYEDIGGQIANDLLARGGQNDSATTQDAWDRLDEIPSLGD